jgi:hypothetical protein
MNLHDPLERRRVLIETLGRWQVWGPDRRSRWYQRDFRECNTPLQLIGDVLDLGRVSIVTPCRDTLGKFEYVVNSSAPLRRCCYTCVARSLAHTPARLPDVKEWIVYMLMESATYMHGTAPAERSALP